MAVFAAMTTLAPSLAAFRAIAFPIPLLAPLMKRVFPASTLTHTQKQKKSDQGSEYFVIL